MAILEDVKELVRDRVRCEYDDIKVETKLVEDLGFDSLDAVIFTIDIEEKFDIEIPDEDIDSIVTIGDVVKYIVERES
jgi:acyl carrier protein